MVDIQAELIMIKCSRYQYILYCNTDTSTSDDDKEGEFQIIFKVFKQYNTLFKTRIYQ